MSLRGLIKFFEPRSVPPVCLQVKAYQREFLNGSSAFLTRVVVESDYSGLPHRGVLSLRGDVCPRGTWFVSRPDDIRGRLWSGLSSSRQQSLFDELIR